MAVAQTMEITMFARSLGAAALVVALAGCGDSGPSGASASSGGSSAESAAAGRSAGQAGVGGGGSMAQPTDTGGSAQTAAGGSAVSGGAGGGGGRNAAGTAGAASSSGGAPGGGSSQGGSGGQASGGAPDSCAQPAGATRLIAFGTTLEPQAQICESRALAQVLAAPTAARWRAKGDQKRSYRFEAANTDVPYRVVVPESWDGKAALPLVMFLHGAGNDESSYLDQNGKQMVSLAQQHGYLLVSPLGLQGAYGTFLRLPAVFGQPAEAAKKIAAITPESESTNELSEKDVINVLELVLNEYPIDRSAMFLTGHSMGSAGTWYLGAKYSAYWAALAPMSGPFVQETGYLWDDVRKLPLFVTEGTQAESLAGSRALEAWLTTNAFELEYKEVNADHPGMVPLVLPDVFAFFDSVRRP